MVNIEKVTNQKREWSLYTEIYFEWYAHFFRCKFALFSVDFPHYNRVKKKFIIRNDFAVKT